MKSTEDLRKIAREVRRDIVEMVYRAGSGHLAGSLSVTDILVGLFFGGVIRLCSSPACWTLKETISDSPPLNLSKLSHYKSDRFILSVGHYCPALYSVLSRLGYFDRKLLWTLRDLGSPLQGHPHRGSLPGVELSTGALGQGLSVGVGKALALRLHATRHPELDSGSSANGTPKQVRNDRRKGLVVFVLMSDGEQNEGQVWEAAMTAAKYKLDNLVGIVDKNDIQSAGNTMEVMPLEDLQEKYEAFGWEVKVIGGNEIGEIIEVIGKIRDDRGTKKPRVVIAKTVAGKGVSFLEGDFRWHAKPIGEGEYKKALEELG